MTITDRIQHGDIPDALRAVAAAESRDLEFILAGLRSGRIVIPQNAAKTLRRPAGIGEGLRTKVNANLGTSPEHENIDEELAKLRVAVRYGADAVMDLSTGRQIRLTRQRIITASDVMVGTVPIYEAAVRARDAHQTFIKMTADDLFGVIEDHGCDGVDFITVHCGATRAVVELLRQQGRVMDIVSRGGSLLVEWMICNDCENPLYEHFDRLLEICRRHDMTLSLGDGLRPGCLADATDRAQIGEMLVLGELTRRARTAGVQVMIEGPGHVPLQMIPENMRLEKSLCEGAPFYVLGPLVTDIAPGYDHITGAIGGAVAGMHGADFLCYVTPAEHLRLPTEEDVRLGVIASKIAAHAADIAKGLPGAMDPDRAMSVARKNLDWDGQFRHALDPELAERMRRERPPKGQSEVCTMCGEFCAVKTSQEAMALLRAKKQ
ncbi:MAG TPA: phosphomethylpyrimidine synthase ThiC [Acidobacteriota bacterium]|jgi:phosphomethylpyrimidine synthase|nr:phosphomethylpyrimidine synthase ThiC [Acidobacteriota bacterium]HNR38570.1 phosphomethylpyrimidine synthase ThiC [Acidobacteriota bacterium]HNU01661.1 phosphomethylpyrimidine synthase ThiC [Acidobacteriota bacterium]HPB27670.1 phosphomethylpyrimidine synthase ThiC [Acidobacteriota bacterium]HQO24952.1 phosphomethylpyrimidine synthase ThiC [Acidobacteriota bacterium]